MIQHACPLGMGLLFCAGVYWSAFTYGFVVVLQVSRKCRFIFTVFSLAAQIKSCLEISKLTKNTPNFMIFFLQNILKIRYYCSFYIQWTEHDTGICIPVFILAFLCVTIPFFWCHKLQCIWNHPSIPVSKGHKSSISRFPLFNKVSATCWDQG